MDREILLKNIKPALNLSEDELDLGYEILVKKVSSTLDVGEAIPLKNIGVFQIQEAKPDGPHKSIPGEISSSSKQNLIYSPFEKEGESLYLNIPVKKEKQNPAQFSEDVFSIGINKPILPVSENINNNLDTDTSYVLLKKSIENRVDELISRTEVLNDFDIFEDFINSENPPDFHFKEPEKKQEEILEPSSYENLNAEIEHEASEEKEINEVEVDSSNENSIDELVKDDINKEDSVEETENNIEEASAEIKDDNSDIEEKKSGIEDEEDLIAALENENLENEDFEDLDSLESAFAEMEKEFEDSEEIEEDTVTKQDSIPIEFKDEAYAAIAEDDLVENQNWDDDLKQDIVDDIVKEVDFDIKEDEPENDDEFSELEKLSTELGDKKSADDGTDDSDELFEQLEESLKEDLESFSGADDLELEDEEVEFSEMFEDDLDLMSTNITEPEDNISEKTEEIKNEKIKNENQEENISEEDNSDEKEDVENKAAAKGDKSIMAKLKQKMGKLFWGLVAVFILVTAGGVYFFLFIPNQKVSEDKLFEELGLENNQPITAIADSSKDTLMLGAADSNMSDIDTTKTMDITEKADKPIDTVEKSDQANTKKEDPKKELTDKINEIKEKVVEKPGKQNTVSEGKTEVTAVKNETQIPDTHIYFNGKSYSFQVSSWKRINKAKKEAERLKNRGHKTFIVKAYLRTLGGTWYRVRIGEFKTLKEVKDYMNKHNFK